MKRVLVVAIALAGLMALPSAAAAVSWKGTVVAKDRARDAVVTVSANGVARTLRTRPAQLRKLRVGQRVKVQAKRRADGTFAAKRLRVLGRTGNVRVRAVVVRSEKGRVLLSAGGSVFAVGSKAARRLANARSALAPGDRVLAHVRVKHGRLVAKWIKETGYADLVEIEGIYLSTSDGVLELAVVHRGRVEVTVPAELSLPELSPGDQIQLLARVGEGGAFTLVALRHGKHHAHHGVDYDHHKIKVRGTLMELSDATVVVQPGYEASAVVCANPTGVALPGFTIGTNVRLECRVGEYGELVVYKLEFENELGELKAKVKYDELTYKAEGMLHSLEPPTISFGEGLEPFSCVAPEEVSLYAFEVGDQAEMKCVLDGHTLVLTELETEHADLDDDQHHHDDHHHPDHHHHDHDHEYDHHHGDHHHHHDEDHYDDD